VLSLRGVAPLATGLLAGGALAGAAVGAADYVFRRLTKPSRPGLPLAYGFTPFETGVDWEDVSFTTEDGATLGGWLLRREAAAPIIIACGGYRNRRSDLLGISSSLWRDGCNVLLFDYRGHGGEPAPVTLGYRELADARAAVQFLRRRLPASPLGAIGFSMGASIAIMLAAREPDVRAVLADSPFTSQREIVRHHMAARFGRRPSPRTEPIAALILSLVDRRLRRQFGFRFEDVHPIRDVAHLAPRPLLLIHGEADAVVPFDHGRRLAAAARAAGVPVETWFLPGVSHCGAYFVDRARYCRRAAAFFHAHLPASPLPDTETRGRGDTEITSPCVQLHDCLQPTRP
jgi:fermentation-respiration switch protein FrsA (DUF1100 family)